MSRYGKIAFVLGGGGARGSYEIGVWKALREMDLKPDIIAGCSVGAINGALIVQDDFDLAVDLWKELKTDMIVDIRLPRRNESPLKKLLNQYIDEETIRSSKMEYGLVTIELPSLEPNYFYKEDIPEGKLIDYLLASSSLFPAFKPQDIDNIKYVDGGYLDNLPVYLAVKKGATHVIAVDLDTAGIVKKEPMEIVDHLMYIHCKWHLGGILTFDGKNSARNIRLGYLDTLKAFSFYDGEYYCFARGEYTKKSLRPAELAGKIFDLDPLLLYTKTTFENKLKQRIYAYSKETEQKLHQFRMQIKNHKPEKDSLIKLLCKINQQTLTLLIADFLKDHPGFESSLFTKPILALFDEEYQAALHLLKQGYI